MSRAQALLAREAQETSIRRFRSIRLPRPPGRTGKALTSANVITDGVWHHVGVVWDGSQRILLVDDIEVAKDTPTNLSSAASGLHLGAGSDLALSTFWTGLIDDVRVYSRAVKP